MKNDLNATIIRIKVEKNQMHGNQYVYSNINNEKQNLILKLLFISNNIKTIL